MSKFLIKTLLIFISILLAVTGCSTNKNNSDVNKPKPTPVKYSELQEAKDAWRKAVEEETNPPTVDSPAPRSLPRTRSMRQPEEANLSNESNVRDKVPLSYDINTKYGITYLKPKGWQGASDAILGWTNNHQQVVSYTGVEEYDKGYCIIPNPKIQFGDVRVAKGFIGFRGRNYLSLKDALLQEIKTVQKVEDGAQYNAVGNIKEFEISGAKALRAHIEFDDMKVSGKCSNKDDAWDIITTKSYYNMQVAVIVIQRALDIENPMTAKQVENLVASSHKTDPKYANIDETPDYSHN